MKRNRFEYPLILEDIADELAYTRSQLSKEYYKGEKNRGDREHEISRLGIIAELVGRYRMKELKLDAVFAPLIELKPVNRPDMRFKGKDYDIKGLKPDCNMLRINAKSFENSNKFCHYYWFISPENGNANTYAYSRDEILRNWKYTKYR